MSLLSNRGSFSVRGSLVRKVYYGAIRYGLTPLQWLLWTPFNKLRNRRKGIRYLEIGPGQTRIEGFETLNVMGGFQVDYIANAAKKLPFGDATFDIIYASHILEHVPWFHTQASLSEWVRVLKPGGSLEVWVPNGLKIAKAFVDAEELKKDDFCADGWWRFNPSHDPCLWMSGRIFSYGDGTTDVSHPNWHHALFSERLLGELFATVGLKDIGQLEPEDVRGFDHGWINLGMRGFKS